MKRRAHHIPKVDTGDDYEFMCATAAFGATVDARDICQPCTKRALAIVDLLAQAYDELAAVGGKIPKRRAALMKRIDKALGKRATVAWPKDAEIDPPGTLRVRDVGDRRVITLTGVHGVHEGKPCR